MAGEILVEGVPLIASVAVPAALPSAVVAVDSQVVVAEAVAVAPVTRAVGINLKTILL